MRSSCPLVVAAAVVVVVKSDDDEDDDDALSSEEEECNSRRRCAPIILWNKDFEEEFDAILLLLFVSVGTDDELLLLLVLYGRGRNKLEVEEGDENASADGAMLCQLQQMASDAAAASGYDVATMVISSEKEERALLDKQQLDGVGRKEVSACR